jgi:hypothetical protein
LSSSSVVSSVISWLENNKNRRFFAFCHINVPHYPYPKNDEEKEFLGDKEEADIERMRNKLKKYSGHQNYSPSGWDQNELEILQGFYDCNLKEADKCVGLIYNKLKELNLDKNTVIIITADHGENLGEHGSFGHGGLPFDSVIKVPLIIIYPPLIPKGVKVDGLTESVDIAPTIINACGIKLPFDKSMDGVNLLEFIQNQNSGKSAVFTPESIRTARYKYISVIGALYDVQKDPGEKVNIARENPLIIEELQDSFKKSMQPYLEHYEAAKRKGTPDYPFYFTLNSFKISPRDALEFTNSELYNNTLVSSEETLLKKPYLLRSCSGPRDCGILINPNADSYPVLTLESHLPNGTYHIFILLESLHDTSPFPELFLDFHFRFNKLKPFSSPYRVNFERNYGRSYCYLDLGEIRVNKELFSVEFKPKPLYTKFYVLRYIKFVPKGCKESEEVEELDNEEFRKEKERLKSLGYL